ncbi:hypothetical protein EJ110_NYTH24435 [Nymphaea thermarum]|nr:hypothetical protein EJ110_NYTH24435 [Nymphaea thermarum]
MTFHFANANWKLPPSNIFRMFGSGIACLTIKDGDMPIFGNVAQQNMHVKYDLALHQLNVPRAKLIGITGHPNRLG